MSKGYLSALAALSLLCPALAHADTLQNFALNASMSNGTTATGTVNFDETTGLFTGGSIAATLGGTNYTFSTLQSSAVYDVVTYANFIDANNDLFQLIIPGASDVNYSGGNICSMGNPTGCYATNGNGANYVSTVNTGSLNTYATGGTLAATPEPSSFVLLGTGILGVFGVARRRFLA